MADVLGARKDQMRGVSEINLDVLSFRIDGSIVNACTYSVFPCNG